MDASSEAAPSSEATTPFAPGDLTVVVCTRDRPDLLQGLLSSFVAMSPAPGRVLVVDNAPTTDATARLCVEFGVERRVAPAPGLDRARNVGWRLARGPLVAYVDDDARVTPGYVASVVEGFDGEEVAAVTGRVDAAELLTRAQVYFEDRGGMSKGSEQRRYQEHDGVELRLTPQAMGVGANMAFRRDVLAQLGGFDPHLDVGTPTRGGGDLDMLSRVVGAGFTVVYRPDALVHHVHRRDVKALLRQNYGYGVGYRAFLAKTAHTSPSARRAVRRRLVAWHLRRHLAEPLRSAVTLDGLGVASRLCEAAGSLRGARAYRRSSAGPAMENS